jgi:hypothetical protein
VGLGAGMGGTENLAATDIRFPDCPAHRKSLCRLRQIQSTRYCREFMWQVCIFILKVLITVKFFGQSEFIDKTLTINLE